MAPLEVSRTLLSRMGSRSAVASQRATRAQVGSNGLILALCGGRLLGDGGSRRPAVERRGDLIERTWKCSAPAREGGRSGAEVLLGRGDRTLED